MAEEKTKNCIWSDKYDQMQYEEVFGKAKKLAETVKGGQERLRTIDGLASDIFSSLYKYVVRENPDDRVLPEYLGNRPFVKKGMETSEYQRLRAVTRLQPAESALATQTILSMLLKEIEEDKEMQQYAQQINQQFQTFSQIQSLQNQIEGLTLSMQSATDTVQKQQIQQKIQQLTQKTQQLQQQLQRQQIQPPTPQKFRQVMTKAMKQASDEVENFSDFITGWGTGAGSPQELPVEEKFKIAEMLIKNPKLKRLSEIVGRFKRLALSKWKNKIKKEPSEVYDVCQGDDLTYILPNELLLLTEPETKTLFYKRYVEKQLLQYDLEAKERSGKGAIICCIDNSGSMAGDREIWSKAVSLALLEIAVKEKRDFYVIHFGDRDDPLKEIFISKTEKDARQRLQKVIEIASYFLGGGTDFEKPLTRALQVINENKDLKKADIVFISDGDCEVSKEFEIEFRKTKKEMDFKMVSVIIAGRSDTLDKLSNQCVQVADIARDGEDVAGTVFSFI